MVALQDSLSAHFRFLPRLPTLYHPPGLWSTSLLPGDSLCFAFSRVQVGSSQPPVLSQRKLVLLSLGLSPLKGQSKLLKAVMFTFSWYPEPCPKHRFDLQEHVCRHVTGQLSLASHIAGRPHSVALRQVSSQEHSQVNRQTDSYSARCWSAILEGSRDGTCLQGGAPERQVG